jgi:hypothetical protein
MAWGNVLVAGGEVKEGSAFSEEKEAKRLLSMRGGKCRSPSGQKFFGSFF